MLNPQRHAKRQRRDHASGKKLREPGGGVSWRYTAYALALELKCPDVDAMLQRMETRQFYEWLAFFRIREELQDDKKQPATKVATTESNKALQAKMFSSLLGYQHRRER